MALNTEELACCYAAAILADDDVAVTADKINTIVKAAGVSIEGIWPSLFARALQGVNVREVIANAVSKGTSGGAGAAGGTTTEQTATQQTESKTEAQPEEESESDDDMGFGLFD